jgi:hypothetical protein
VLSYAFANKIRQLHASVQAHGRPFLTFCANRVNIGNSFYYGFFEYAQYSNKTYFKYALSA